jgi:hypothetical protein
VVFGEKHVPETEGLGARFQGRHYGWVGPAGRGGGELGGVDGVGGNAFFVDEFFYLIIPCK